jgi:hypothetical protein
MSAKPVEPLHPFVERQGTGDDPASAIATGDKPGAAQGKAVERFRPAVGQRALCDEEIARPCSSP